MMFKVSVEEISLFQSDNLKVFIEHDSIEDYDNIQITLFDVAVKNPTFKFSTGSKPKKIKDNLYELSINISSLIFGLYEIKSIKLHNQETSSEVNLISMRDFDRILLEITPTIQNKNSSQEILNIVTKSELFYKKEFLKPIDIRIDKSKEVNTYGAFVFIRNMLIRSKVRFDNYDLLPTQKGLDKEHHLKFVNDFLADRTSTGIKFTYTEENQKQDINESPVCVTYFPTIIASNNNEVVSYSQQETSTLLQALALLRDSSGEIFDTVIINHTTSEASKFSTRNPYYGNLVSGVISGENPDTMETYIAGLKQNPFNSFLVHLYKEARNENNPDFQYIRYWQILETLAENQNYNETDLLVDYENNLITRDNGRPLKVKGAKHIVFNLLREHEVGSTDSMWKNVNIWIAFRNVVSHFGSIREYNQLDSEFDRTWAEQAFNEIIEKGHDSYLWELKEDVKLILQKIVVGATS